jgi:signal transduction histidine kinase
VEAAIGTVRASLEEAHREIRTLSYLLYPPDLSRHGLAKTLRHFVAGFCRRTGLRGRATVSPAVDRLPVELQRSVLRVVQEALVNVHRHAKATRVAVEVRLEEASLRLRVHDNGQGLPTTEGAEPAAALGVGIPGMQARIRQFGGVLEIDGARRGTTVRAVIPLGSADDRNAPISQSPSQGFT